MKNKEKKKGLPADESKMKKAKRLFIALTVIFALTTAGLSVWLGLSRKEVKAYNIELENHYQQAYFELIGQVNDMEVKAAKLLVTSSSSTQQELLYDIWKGAEVSSNSLAALSSKDASVVNATKFINQMGDYCFYLAKQVGGGKKLEDTDIESLTKIHEILVLLGRELAEIQTAIAGGYLFLENMGTENDMLASLCGNLNGGSIEYPQLIYDGPFSDGLQDKQIKYAVGDDITKERGQEIAGGLFGGFTVEKVEFMGEWDTDIDTFNYEVKLQGIEQEVEVQITKAGGIPVSISTFLEVSEPTLSEEECGALAVQYLAAMGFADMTPVWSSNINSTVYINLAPVENGVILYPDLIKVKIASDTGRLVGLDSKSYCYNHIERQLPQATVSVEQAKAKITTRAEVTGGRLVLIPKENAEILCYEFSASLNGDYLVYIDALTGEEANILFIIDAENGSLIM